jgi:hypothetical protein
MPDTGRKFDTGPKRARRRESFSTEPDNVFDTT